jgi:hypothetical protein
VNKQRTLAIMAAMLLAGTSPDVRVVYVAPEPPEPKTPQQIAERRARKKAKKAAQRKMRGAS